MVRPELSSSFYHRRPAHLTDRTSCSLSPPVCAGMVIASEAGGRTFGSKTSALSADASAEMVTGRKYLVIRGIPEGKDGQEKLAREFYEHVIEWDQL